MRTAVNSINNYDRIKVELNYLKNMFIFYLIIIFVLFVVMYNSIIDRLNFQNSEIKNIQKFLNITK